MSAIIEAMKFAIVKAESGLELIALNTGSAISIEAPWPFLRAFADLEPSIVLALHEEIKRQVRSTK